MAKRKTDAQVEREAKKLKELKPNVRRLTGFGDDNHARIDAQVAVLEERLDEDAIYERYGSEDGNEGSPTLDAALDALRWVEGEVEDGLAKGWAPLAKPGLPPVRMIPAPPPASLPASRKKPRRAGR